MKHQDLIPTSPCQGTLLVVRHGVYENVGWTVHRCLACGAEVKEFPPQAGIANSERPGVYPVNK